LKNTAKKAQTKKMRYALSPNSFSNKDIVEGIKILLSKRITMGKITKRFKKEFAKFIGSKYALMVNSRSFANLLATFAMVNPMKENRLKIDEI